MIGRAGRQGNPVPAADHAGRAAADRPDATLAIARGSARLRPHRRASCWRSGRGSTGRSAWLSSPSRVFVPRSSTSRAILGPTAPPPLAVQADAAWMQDPAPFDALLRLGRSAAAARRHGLACWPGSGWNMLRPCCAAASSAIAAGGSAATAPLAPCCGGSAPSRCRRWSPSPGWRLLCPVVGRRTLAISGCPARRAHLRSWTSAASRDPPPL